VCVCVSVSVYQTSLKNDFTFSWCPLSLWVTYSNLSLLQRSVLLYADPRHQFLILFLHLLPFRYFLLPGKYHEYSFYLLALIQTWRSPTDNTFSPGFSNVVTSCTTHEPLNLEVGMCSRCFSLLVSLLNLSPLSVLISCCSFAVHSIRYFCSYTGWHHLQKHGHSSSFPKDVSICLTVFFHTTYAVTMLQHLCRKFKTLSFQFYTSSLSAVCPFLYNNPFLLISQTILLLVTELSPKAVFWLYMLSLQFPYFIIPHHCLLRTPNPPMVYPYHPL